jgi:V-type H+-transporting ATPase subunit a
MELFRSEPMQYVRLTITQDAAVETMRELGKMGKFHLVDLNEHSALQTESFLFYKKRVVQCNYWERKLQRFEEVMIQNELEVPPIHFAEGFQVDTQGDLLSVVKAYVDPIENELNRNLEYKAAETKKMNELYERAVVLEVCKANLFKAGAFAPPGSNIDAELKRPLMQDSHYHELVEEKDRRPVIADEAGRFHNYICGVMPVLQQPFFERMLFRISRGNAYARYSNVEEEMFDSQTGEKVKKAVFYVAYVGQQIGRRIEKMCDFFRATRYDVPTTPQDYDMELHTISVKIQEKRQVLDVTQAQIMSLLSRIAFDGPLKETSPLRNYLEALRCEKVICDALKRCHSSDGSSMLTAEGWCPVEEVENLQTAMREAAGAHNSQPVIVEFPKVKGRPPTYFKLNKFTSSFQAIVDTYGVPRYQEVNPGLFTIVTFPFLFGIMYGDIGHGILLFLGALYMVVKEKELEAQVKNKTINEIVGMAFGGRYMLLSMGIAAIYCGIIYNDCLSIPLNVWGSAWHFEGNATTASGPTWVYPIGLDPSWLHTKNVLTFANSLKMKIAVTFGVIHMIFGITLSLFNHIYFNNRLSIYFEFIPQMVFMLCTFGYMIFMIIVKFTIDWSDPKSGSPPNLIQTMISMFLSPGTIDNPLYNGQGPIQVVLVLLAVFSVPMMLFPKPYIERYLHEKNKVPTGPKKKGAYFEDAEDPELAEHDEKKLLEHKEGSHAHGSHSAEGHGGGGHGDDEEEYNFSEHFIHQAIHTIEFVLGAVSNTASYLRLWALSLAHAELSDVFWEKMIMDYGISSGSPIMGFIGFGAWAGATAAVLLSMDVLECFLHALRLHWVEFQNKFFQADGYAFVPFDFIEKDDE